MFKRVTPAGCKGGLYVARFTYAHSISEKSMEVYKEKGQEEFRHILRKELKTLAKNIDLSAERLVEEE